MTFAPKAAVESSESGRLSKVHSTGGITFSSPIQNYTLDRKSWEQPVVEGSDRLEYSHFMADIFHWTLDSNWLLSSGKPEASKQARSLLENLKVSSFVSSLRVPRCR